MTAHNTDRRLERVAAFVRDHGFRAWIERGAVKLAIPRLRNGSPVEDVVVAVRTLPAARRALGY